MTRLRMPMNSRYGMKACRVRVSGVVPRAPSPVTSMKRSGSATWRRPPGHRRQRPFVGQNSSSSGAPQLPCVGSAMSWPQRQPLSRASDTGGRGQAAQIWVRTCRDGHWPLCGRLASWRALLRNVQSVLRFRILIRGLSSPHRRSQCVRGCFRLRAARSPALA
jgi:hypothetical protein